VAFRRKTPLVIAFTDPNICIAGAPWGDVEGDGPAVGRARFTGDTIALGRESLEGEALLELAMSEGIRAQPRKSLNDIRERCAAELDRLPEAHKALKDPQAYPGRVVR
jgi:hypothetical protein